MLLSPSGRGVLAPPGRPSSRYYEHVFYSLLQHGMTTNGTPRSVVDVGSSAPPFLEHIEFLPDRTILAPFFRDYNSSNGYNSTEEQTHAAPLGIKQITEDFAEWIPTKRWGIAVCMQTLEHVANPSAFLAKLRKVSDITIVSVPYRWQDHLKTEHLSHDISEATIKTWVELDSNAHAYEELHAISISIIRDIKARMLLVFSNKNQTSTSKVLPSVPSSSFFFLSSTLLSPFLLTTLFFLTVAGRAPPPPPTGEEKEEARKGGCLGNYSNEHRGGIRLRLLHVICICH
jgi:hypothetical protein